MLEVEFTVRLGEFEAGISFAAESGHTFVLVGESGAGKTTILNVIAGLVQPDRGRIRLEGICLFDGEVGIVVPVSERPIGYVFQEYLLFPHLNVFENVAFGLRAQRLPDKEIAESTWSILKQLEIDDLAKKHPHRLSGGQRQRAALARALVLKPKVLLLDEPLAALDAQTKREVRSELRATLASLSCVTLFVTHSPFEAMVFGDQVGVVDHGKIVQIGVGEELLRRPRSRYVATLMGLNLFHGRVLSRKADGLAEIETRDGIVHAISEDVRDETFIAVDPREITLHTQAPSGTAQNVFPGRIRELTPEPPLGERLRVVVDSKPPLVAEITLHSVQTLALHEGMNIFASFKATAAKSY